MPQKVGGPQTGKRNNLAPAIKALPDGRVYLAYERVEPGIGYQLRLNRSLDFGRTWQPDDLIVWTGGSIRNLQIDAIADGRVYLSWSDLSSVYFALSTNSGLSFSTTDIDQETGSRNNYYPSMCAQGLQVFVAWFGYSNSHATAWAVRSVDGGGTWEPRVLLYDSPFWYGPWIACAPGAEASTFWIAYGADGFDLLMTRHFRDGTWLPATAIDTPPQAAPLFDGAGFASPSDLVVAYENSDESPSFGTNAGVFAVRSTDGGVTFQQRVRLNDASPSPTAGASSAHLGTDGGQAVWVQWLDGSAGAGSSIAARCSTDGGASWGPVRRMNREQPQGGMQNTNYLPLRSPLATFPRSGLFIWEGTRETVLYDVIVNSWSLDDFDRDGVGTGTDCLDSDPDVWQPPLEIQAVNLRKLSSGVEIRWSSQSISAGSGTRYDIVTGVVGELVADRGYPRSTCLVAGQSDASYVDARPSPAGPSASYYLVRASNACGTGGYGDSGLSPDPRDNLDAHGPCP